MNSITIDNLDSETLTRLRLEAQRRGTDVAIAAAELLRERLSFPPANLEPPPYHDLDQLAGTWTQEEASEFEAAVVPFSDVDEDLWK